MKPPQSHPEATPPSRLQLPQGPWKTVLEALCARFPAIPRATWENRFARGRVQDATGQPIGIDTAYRAGLEIRYFREVHDEPVIPFDEAVLHIDGHLVVADKPHFLPVVPAGGFVEQTLLARLVRRLGNRDLVPLHRIDRGTAGLVLFSANPASRGIYQALFRERRIDKGYEALASPMVDVAFPHVHRSRLERGEPFFRMEEVAGAANSETRIEVIDRHADGWRYRLQPVTGRKHQLRVHMAALGAPIFNDALYPGLRPQVPDDYAAPLKLLARSLAFTDPLTGAVRHFQSRRELATDASG